MAVAIDCEFVQVIFCGANKDAVGRVSLVDDNGTILLDSYIKPNNEVSDYRTFISGITASDLANGKPFHDVKIDILNIISGKTLIGHDIEKDMTLLDITHQNIRDTSMHPIFLKNYGGQYPSLKDLARDFLNETIQVGKHDPVEDARAAMKLYKKYPW